MNAEALAYDPTRRLAPPGWELLLPLAVAAVTQVEVWAPYGMGHMVGPRPVIALVYALTAAALFWRRRAPLAVLAFVLSLDAIEYLAFGAPEGLGTFLPPLFAFYAVGRYASTNSLVLAAPLVALGTAVHELKDPLFGVGGSVVFWVILASAWPIGHAFRRGAEEAVALVGAREESARVAVAAERARIARELHDVVGHGLSVLVLQLVAALGVQERGNAAAVRERLLAVEQMARETLAEMRRLLDLIDEGGAAELAPQPGLGELERLLADTRAAGAELELTTMGEPRELPPGVELAAFRILQESLTNVLKHAKPPRAQIRLVYEPEALTLAVDDEGRGAAGPNPAGRGLAGMRERTALYGGRLDAGARAEGGFRVHARLPLAHE